MYNKKNTMKEVLILKHVNLYWLSFIVQDTENSKPWVCAISSGEFDLEKVLEMVKDARNKYRVLSAWIDTFDENDKKTTVFHECYINFIGDVEK
jgi:hypothetical protein